MSQSASARLIISILAGVLAWAPPHASAQTTALETRVVFIKAADSHDAAITDLTASDISIKEDGKRLRVLAVEPATGPLQIVVVVDDDGSGVFRYGLTRFAELLQGKAEMSVRFIRGQVQELFGFTTDVDRWMAGIRLLGVRPPTPGGGQLLEGIDDAAKDLRRREARRPVIVVLTTGGGEQSPLDSDRVLDDVRDSGASLHVVYAGSQLPAAPVTRPSDLMQSNFHLEHVIGDGPKESGGVRRDVIATQAVLTTVQQIARDLVSQLAVSYAGPPGKSGQRSLSVSTSRRGVKITAPTRTFSRR